MAEVSMQLPLMAIGKSSHKVCQDTALAGLRMALYGRCMLPLSPVLCFLCYFLHSVKGGRQSHPPSLEMWRLGEVHMAGSDLAQVPWAARHGYLVCCSGPESQSPEYLGQLTNRCLVWMMTEAIFALKYNSDSLKASRE